MVPRGFLGFGHRAAHGVFSAGGVGELRFPEGAHGLDHARVHRRGGVVVQIDGLVGQRHGGKMGRNGVWG